jgi:hypothetical protein
MRLFTKKRQRTFLSRLILASIVFVLSVFAVDWAHSKGKGQKVIDFEDEVVEGMNKQPLDSVSQLSDLEKRRKRPHLYRKRKGFKSEVAETVSHLRYVQ